MWISLGNVAEVALVFAQTDPEKKHSGPRLLPGPHRDRGLRLAGDPRQARAALLRHRGDLARRRRGRRRRAARRGRRWLQGRDERARQRRATASPPAASGSATAASTPRSPTPKERKQFGVPIASFQLVQELIADMIVKQDAARMLVYRAGELKDRRRPQHGRDLDREVLRDRGGGRVRQRRDPGATAAPGYVDDYPVERYLRDARVTTLYEGTSQIHKLIIGRDATGINAMVPPSECVSDVSKSASSAPGRWAPGIAQIAALGGYRDRHLRAATSRAAPARARAAPCRTCAAAPSAGAGSEQDADRRPRADLSTDTIIEVRQGLRPGDRGGARGPRPEAEPVSSGSPAVCGPDTVSPATPLPSRSLRSRRRSPEPQRIVGMHFFNPPALMQASLRSWPATRAPSRRSELATEVARGMGRTPIRARDSGRLRRQPLRPPLLPESLRMLA